MRLEDATKEELIYIIKCHSFVFKNFEVDILNFRIEKILEEQEQLNKRYKEARDEYVRIVKIFNDTPIKDIPEETFDKGIQLSDELTSLQKKISKKEKEYEKYSKMQDRILQI